MTRYLVRWEIVVDADSAENAARKALEVQFDPFSKAVAFDVTDEQGDVQHIDLAEIDGWDDAD
ncbi:hypothetical protein LZ518_08525 [Sphingomonas sp. RB56-2]|uniref:Uncharacterized protein n=1 Tax=Sphingomonas brevis TaxID=2908206 RepID=A0ABT0S9V1_9SPHN|nr:hypothetical protein [Sphingomonas brevis]MCL6741174.1 hypothetical protein [Sphingomonas brevis]